MPIDMELAELSDAMPSNGDANAPRGVRELEAVYDIPVTVSAVDGSAGGGLWHGRRSGRRGTRHP